MHLGSLEKENTRNFHEEPRKGVLQAKKRRAQLDKEGHNPENGDEQKETEICLSDDKCTRLGSCP